MPLVGKLITFLTTTIAGGAIIGLIAGLLAVAGLHKLGAMDWIAKMGEDFKKAHPVVMAFLTVV